MPKTKVAIEFFLNTTSTEKVSNIVFLVQEILIAHKAGDTFVTMSGPFPDANSVTAATKVQNDDEGEGKRVGRGRDASNRDGDGDGDDVDPVDKPRGRGRPRKSAAGSAEEAGPSSGERVGRGKASAGSEAGKRNVAAGTDEGADEGDGGRAEGRRRSAGSAEPERGNRSPARVSTGKGRGEADDDWADDADKSAADEWADDEKTEADQARLLAARSSHSWPDELMPVDDVDKTMITGLLSDHFTASGGKDKALTFDILEDVTGERALRDVKENDYTPLVKALLKDIACYEFGLKKPKG